MTSILIHLGGKYGTHAMRVDVDFEDVFCDHKWLGFKPQKSRTMYARAHIDGRHTYAHHLVIGAPPTGYVVDHINGDGLDNRRSNLRFVTHAENMQHAHNRKTFRPGKNSTGGIQIVHKKFGIMEQTHHIW